ncbi:MAG: hypothetical protein ACREQ5_06675, partial [Candidatus Dormibacteria bacterium]
PDQVPLTPAQVSAVVMDPELRALRPGSPEYQAKLVAKFAPAKDTATVESTDTEQDDEESANDDVSEGSTPDEVSTDAKVTAKKGIDKRISNLTAKSKLLEEENAKLRADAEALKSAGKSKETPTSASNAVQYDAPKPKIDDFRTMSEFQEALTDWKIDKKEFDRDQSKRETEFRTNAQKDFETFRENGKKLESELELEEGSFQLLMEDLRSTDTAPVMVLQTSPNGAQIAYDIASNEAELTKFNNMNPAQQLVYIGKAEAKYETKKQTATGTKTLSSAKAPGKTLAKGSVSLTKGIEFKTGMTSKQFEAMLNAQRMAKGKKPLSRH